MYNHLQHLHLNIAEPSNSNVAIAYNDDNVKIYFTFPISATPNIINTKSNINKTFLTHLWIYCISFVYCVICVL